MSHVKPEFVAAVSAHTGVPAELLTGDTAEAVWDSAQRAVDWKASTAQAPPPTAAVAPSMPSNALPVQQAVRSGDWLAAWHSGALAGYGAPAPPPRQVGPTRHAP